MRKLGKLLLTSAILLPACADDEVDGDTARSWRATSTAIGNQGSQWQSKADADGKLATDLACTGGGGYAIEGSITDENAFDVSITFDGCTADGVIISGELALHAEVEVTESSSRVHLDYQGELTFSGEVDTSCEIDVTAEVAVQVSGGNEPSAHVDASFHGEICGYSADAVVDASAHG